MSQMDRFGLWEKEVRVKKFKPLRSNATPTVVEMVPWRMHSTVNLTEREEQQWISLQGRMQSFRESIFSAAMDMEYFGKQLQYAAQRFCSKHSGWSFSHECGALYMPKHRQLTLNRFGHAAMKMECKFDLQIPQIQLQLPPNWTYGSAESLERAFTSLAFMAIERSELMDCVALWLNGLLTKFVKNKGHLWGFQRAKHALTELQESQELVLRHLEKFKEDIKRQCRNGFEDSSDSEESDGESENYDRIRRWCNTVQRSFGREDTLWTWTDRFETQDTDH
jgi:hypothetical protein